MKEHSSAAVSALASGARGLGLIPTQTEKVSLSENAPLALLARIMLIQCSVLLIRMLTLVLLNKLRATTISNFQPIRLLDSGC